MEVLGMVQETEPVGTPIAMTGQEALLLGLLAGGSRLLFAAPSALERDAVGAGALARHERRLRKVGGALIRGCSDREAALMAAGAALTGEPAALATAESAEALQAVGTIGAALAMVDLSGRLPLSSRCGRAVILGPHHAGAAFEMASQAPTLADLRGLPVVVVGGETPEQPVEARRWDGSPYPPIHHDGPDDPEILLVGAGGSFDAIAEARESLEAEGVAAAHLHILQVRPFPVSITAPAFSSARRLMVVEPVSADGEPALGSLLRAELCPAAYLHELARTAGAPVSAAEVAMAAREVLLR